MKRKDSKAAQQENHHIQNISPESTAMSNGCSVLLTGSTGAIGSMHLLELLSRGYQVACLVRAQNKDAAYGRLAQIVGEEAAGRVKIVVGDITEELGGVSGDVVSELQGSISTLVHHAGSVRFEEKYADEIIDANAGGTANMLALAEAIDVRRFCYSGTAYSIGHSRNAYEASKKTAAQLVRKWQGGEWMVWHPSVVVGHSKTGLTIGFTGYYGFFGGFFSLKQQLRRAWENDSHDSCLKKGFSFREDVLILDTPLCVSYSLHSTLNLVPVDWLVKAMTDLMCRGEWQHDYNITHPEPPKIAWVIGASLDILGIEGVKQASGEDSAEPVSVKLKEE